MTDAEWESCNNPQHMLLFLSAQASQRKSRLFAVACCRRVGHRLTDPRSRAAVEMAERYADERVGKGKWLAAYQAFCASRGPIPSTPAFFAHAAVSHLLADAESDPGSYAAGASSWTAGAGRSYAEEQAAQAALVRCIFGPIPLWSSAIDAAVLRWNDRLVPRLARAIYDERRWADLSLLADALLDAGCANESLMAHCRAGGEHARGCWAVDTILDQA